MINYNDGCWHLWSGGECPVHPKSVVKVRLCSRFDEHGDMTDRAENWEWPHEGDSGNIIAFRVVTPYVEPKPETGALAELNVKPGDVVEFHHPFDGKIRHIIAIENGRIVSEESGCGLGDESPWTLISRAPEPMPYGHVRLSDGTVFDMTSERQPAFGMLTKEEQAAMRAHGGPYQYLGYTWNDRLLTQWIDSSIYRVKPQPVRVTVTRDMCADAGGHLLPWGTNEHTPVTVTYETINGVPDYSTYRVEVK